MNETQNEPHFALNFPGFGIPLLDWRMAQKRTPHRADHEKKPSETLLPDVAEYSSLMGGIGELLESARRAPARAVNALRTATYWEIGRRIVEFEQNGRQRAQYGERLLDILSSDLTARFGRGFGLVQVRTLRQFFLAYSVIRQSPIDELGVSSVAPVIRQSGIEDSLRATPGILQRLGNRFPQRDCR